MFLSVLTVSLIFLLSCKTALSAAKVKEDTHTSTENAMAERVTKQCPVEIDEATTLTKLEYKAEQHALVYTYLFSGGVYEDMNEQIWAMIQKATESMLKEKLKTNQMLYQIRKDGTTLIYIYTDKNGKELFSVTLQPGAY